MRKLLAAIGLAFALAFAGPLPSQAVFDDGNLICETTSTTGTGTVNLAGACTNYVTFLSQITSGAETTYTIVSGDGKIETGRGVFTDGAPDTLTRSALWSTDGSGAELSLTGVSTVYLQWNTDSYRGGVNNFDIADLQSDTGMFSTSVDITSTGQTLVGAANHLTVEGQTIWDSGNDGAGSTLDADLLDGSSSAAFALSARNLIAGAGLTGGGDLSADRTFTVGAGTAITVNADDVAVTANAIGPTQIDETASYDWTGIHTFDSDAVQIDDTNASHQLVLTPGSDLTADRVLTITTGDSARTLTFTADATIGGTTSGTNTGDQAAGNGLTGTSTLAVGAGTCITSNADDVAVTANCIGATQIDETATYAWTGTQSWDTGTATFSNNIRFPDAEGIFDTSGNEQLLFQSTASAVNQFDITNSAANGVQRLEATGGDAAIAVTIASKSTDPINLEINAATEATLNATNFSPGANDGNALGVSGTAWAELFLAAGGLIEFDGGTTNSLTCTGGNCTIEGNALYRAGGTDVAVADGGTGASSLTDLITLTTHTTGNYVGSAADGTGIDGTAAGEGATYTPTLDLTEISSATWGGGAFTAFTFDAGAVDPVLTFGSGTLTFSALAQINFDDELETRWFEEDAGGANYVGFKAPAALTASVTCTFENDANPIPDSCVGDGSDASGADGLGPDGDKGDVTVGGTGTTLTIDADSVALTTDTTGNYVGSVADGTGIDGTAAGEGATYTPTIDFSELTFGTGLTSTGASTLDCDTATTGAVGCTSLATTTEVLTGTDTGKAVTADALAALWEKGSNVASAGTVSLGEGWVFHITGTTTITDIDFATAKDGRQAVLVFDGALTLTHNATTLDLPGGANITTAAGDVARITQDSGDNIKVTDYVRDASPPISGTNTGDQTITLTGDVTGSGTGSFAATIAANSVALGTDTTNDYVATVADGTGIDGTATGETSTYTPTLDLTEVTEGTGIDLLATTISLDFTEITSLTWGVNNFTTMVFSTDGEDLTWDYSTVDGAAVLQGDGSPGPILGIEDGGQLRFFEEDAGGANTVSFIGPATVASDRTCQLVDGAAMIPDSCVGDGTDAGGGGAQITGTPADNQVAVWVSATNIEGDSAFTFDTATDALSIGTSGVFTAGTIELGAASDTTLARGAAGEATVEGLPVLTVSGVQAFTSGSAATYTPTSGTKFVKVTCTGGGGGGGGSDSDGTGAGMGGGGEAGGTAIIWYDLTELGANAVYTIGALGAGGTVGAAGTDGADTTFNPAGSGATITAAGGDGGDGVNGTTDFAEALGGTAEGTASGGDVNLSGGSGSGGHSGVSGADPVVISGTGGGSYWGGGGGGLARSAVGANNTAGIAAGANGSGGGGAITLDSATGAAGGNGAVGMCVVEEYGS